MGEIRRNSVDVPITRTLVALRRVRSLRDPCTNSMSKFASLLDNVKWETGSTNEISLQFVNQGNVDDNAVAKADGLYGSSAVIEEQENGCGIKESVHTSRSSSERSCGDITNKGRELACISPVEDVDSSSGPNIEERKYRNWYPKNSNKSIGDFASRTGSPIPSTNNNSYMDEEIDEFDQCSRGCGITYCWTRTPRYRGSNQSSDVEDYPLLSGNGNRDESPYGRDKLRRNRNNEVARPCLEMQKSLSQKFRPKSFDELVGQEVVVKCLLSTILRGRITSLYLFHGPRGTGKTSTSRIFAAALNCLSSANHSRPCGLCRECHSFFSGRSRDTKEIDSAKLNRSDYLRSLIKSAYLPPSSSRFKVFIIDECHSLCQEAWAMLNSNLESFSQHVVFIMLALELEKLPQNVVSRSQKYHFPKLKDVDISRKLAKICVEEGVDFDQAALDFIASKSDGSLRDAETMVDQLSLLGKRITTSLAYELIGVVSDDELLGLLDLALSSDTSNTVIRARELMRSKIDPMQLISQLANLIMDIIAEKCQESTSAARHRFLTRHSSEEEMLKLSHALKILSDAEKHLRASKNQTTWLTVALLQLSNADLSSLAANESGLCLRSQRSKEADLCSTSSEGGSSKQLAQCPGDVKSQHEEHMEHSNGTLESVWKRVIELCSSDSLRSFLWKRGKLASLIVDKGVAIAELEFYTPQHVSRTEKSWKVIAGSFQSVLGCNVEIRINLALSACSPAKVAKTGNLLVGFFSCSRRIRQKPSVSIRCDSEHSDCASEKHAITEARVSTRSNGCEDRKFENSLRSSGGNVLSFGKTTFRGHSICSVNTSSRMSCSSDQGDPMKESNGNHTYMNDHDLSRSEHGRQEDSDVLCWRTPMSKGRGDSHQHRSSGLIGRVLPCAATT